VIKFLEDTALNFEIMLLFIKFGRLSRNVQLSKQYMYIKLTTNLSSKAIYVTGNVHIY